MAHSHPTGATLGCEVEFLIPYTCEESPDPHEGDDRHLFRFDRDMSEWEVKEPLYEALAARYRRGPSGLLAFTGRQAARAMMPGASASDIETPAIERHWVVKGDSSVNEWAHCDRTGARKYKGWLDVETNTAVFRQQPGSPNDYWKIISETFSNLRRQERVRINSTCGLHVHVGLEDKSLRDPEQLLTLKRLASVLWLAEDRLQKLYHPVRRGDQNPFATSLARGTVLARCPPEEDEYQVLQSDGGYKRWIRPVVLDVMNSGVHGSQAAQVLRHFDRNMLLLWRAKDWKDLAPMLRAYDFGFVTAYNFDSLFYHGTIEFRGMEASLDSQMFEHWPAVCAKIVLSAQGPNENSTVERFHATLKKLLRPGYNGWSFLRDVGCDQTTVAYFTAKCKRDEEAYEQIKETLGREPKSHDDDLASPLYPGPFFVPKEEERL